VDLLITVDTQRMKKTESISTRKNINLGHFICKNGKKSTNIGLTKGRKIKDISYEQDENDIDLGLGNIIDICNMHKSFVDSIFMICVSDM